MKNILTLGVIVFLLSCSKDNDKLAKRAIVSFQIQHAWGEKLMNTNDYDKSTYFNSLNQQITLQGLRYVISEFSFTHSSGEEFLYETHFLVDISDPNTLTFQLPEDLPFGEYSQVNFRFGLSDDYNIDGAYPDLNSISFNVPTSLGGGYHFIQMDGTYAHSNNSITPFNYHAISAYNSNDPTEQLDTSFLVQLGAISINKDTTVTIKSDVSEWFQNPNEWDLEVLYTNLMGNYEAQVLMCQNGKSVFSLISKE